MYCSLNSDDTLCHTCYRHLKEKKIPPCSSMNDLKFPVKPSELDLTQLEERLHLCNCGKSQGVDN